MIINIPAMLDEHRVAYTGPNARGWVELYCPKCGKHHLGISSSGTCFCWYCLKLPRYETYAAILHIPTRAVKSTLEKYTVGFISPADAPIPCAMKVTWPPKVEKLTTAAPHQYLRYIEKRGLEVEEVLMLWQPYFASHVTPPPHTNRLFAPCVYQNEIVSWQARSLSDDAAPKYITSKNSESIIPPKESLYGIDYVRNRAVVVEGLFDVWKGGPGCVHTFGVSWTGEQLLLLAALEKVVVAYDNEPGAQRAAERLAISLSGLLVDVEIYCSESYNDFGEADVGDVRQLVRELLGDRE